MNHKMTHKLPCFFVGMDRPCVPLFLVQVFDVEQLHMLNKVLLSDRLAVEGAGVGRGGVPTQRVL